MAEPPRDIIIKYRLDTSAAVAAFETLAAQCATAAEALRQIAAKYRPTCVHTISAVGQPPEWCGEPVADDDVLCPTHRYAVDGDNSDEPVGFDD